MLTAAEALACVEQRQGYVVDEHTGCWICPERTAAGFGPYLAFYVAVYGEPPEGFEVYHLCEGGRRGCVRPSHLDTAPAGSRVRHVPDPALTAQAAGAFAQRIRDERAAARAARPDFALMLGVSPRTLRDWEEGRSQPSAALARHIAAKLGWGGPPRQWVVTFVHEAVVSAPSAGQAVGVAYESVSPEGAPRRTALYNVRPARRS